MGANSKIEWTDHTFNPWVGCAHKLLADGSDHPACEHCYAEAFTKFTGFAKWGPEGTRVKTSEKYWRQPLAWNAAAEKERTRRRVFCASYADVFEEWTGPLNSHDGLVLTDQDMREESFSGHPIDMVREDLFIERIDKTPWLDWLLLTKRPENIRRMWPGLAIVPNGDDCFERRDNVWLGTSISDQATANAMIPELLACRDLVPVLFLSIEPLLGPINLRDFLFGEVPIDWVIVGGESGHHARPMHPDWARSIRNQCAAAHVPFFFKQWGEWLPVGQHLPDCGKVHGATAVGPGRMKLHYGPTKPAVTRAFAVHGVEAAALDDDKLTFRIGKKEAGRLLDGEEWSEYPPPEVHP